MKHVILIGFMGAGKTSVGKRLASHLELKFTDTDDLIVQEQNMPVRAILPNNYADDCLSGRAIRRDGPVH